MHLVQFKYFKKAHSQLVCFYILKNLYSSMSENNGKCNEARFSLKNILPKQRFHFIVIFASLFE